MEKRWDFKAIPEEELIDSLSEEINVSKPMATILCQRGISTFEQAKAFFRPQLSDLHDPWLMKDMDIAIDRINKAIENEEKILIYGDYDVDGTTSVALVFGYLNKFYQKLDFYVPDRYKEGYGISQRGVDYAHQEGASLIIALDCGIKALDKVEYAKKFGIDFIICDHHNPGENLPKAVAVLDPKRKDCPYPFKELSGCGIGYKLLQALAQTRNLPQEDLLEMLDLPAISSACDIVPLNGENRILVKYGLELLNEEPRTGLKALIVTTAREGTIDVNSMVFGLGPRINAAGRIAHANQAVKLLLSEDEEEAQDIAKQVNNNNTLRKTFDESITGEALALIEEHVAPDATSSVLYKSDWHKGIVGIVASRCIEKYYRPTIILTESNGKATGSARSVDGFDLYEAISECSEFLEQYGGHKHAAGMTLQIENIKGFAEKFEEVVSSRITPEQLVPKINIDLQIDLDQINYNFYKVMRQMAPFGPANMHPVFVSEVVCSEGHWKLLKEKHLKLSVRQEGTDRYFNAIGFSMEEFYDQIEPEVPFLICYNIEENIFRGEKSLQLHLKDLKFPNHQA
ncbi:single-stranded-DNA-specific exonuclease RecJ [Flammeovirgaceae bacterium SG7u.111]|nr:single-stranded-DNA-specific exonuclease RecJ [Flammeovirgaceae bacterium SG7u.132]WPO35484.1 single-stranded-DNA-specific exonuclease RecJ [Flammeovirgaceae bacterium SG7u.111]